MESKTIYTTTPCLYSTDDDFKDDRFTRCRISVMHTGENLNNSSFSKKVVLDAKDSFKNIPILADIVTYKDKDGNEVTDFAGHTMRLEDDKFHEGEQRVAYVQKVVGIIPESNDFELAYDSEHDWYVPVVTAYIFNEYGGYTKDIIENRGGKVNVSAEIFCPDISVDAKTGVMIVNEMKMSGVTLLGERVMPAMEGSVAQTFSISENDKNQQLIEVIRELKDSLDKYTASKDADKVQKKGGQNIVKFEELLKKYNKTKEDINFETEGLTDEELEAKFAEEFADPDGDPVTDEGDPDSKKDAEPTDTEPESEPTDSESEVPTEPEVADPEPTTNSRKFNMNGKEFSVSLSDIQWAVEDLVNETYGEQDDVYYSCDVFLDDKKVVMHSWSGKSYRQDFKVRDNKYSLVGDRIEVRANWLSADEEKALENLKANYSSATEELKKYHEEPKKEEILNNEAYSVISETDDFKKLKDDHFNMSVEDVQKKADELLLNAAKNNTEVFAHKDTDNKPTAKPLPKFERSFKKSRYGNLFNK